MKVPKSQKPLYEKNAQFLFAMARLEYALKVTGYIKSDGEADWGRFAQGVAPYFEAPSAKVDEAITYLLANPPHKLKFREGQLGWEEARPPIAMPVGELILLYLRRLRSNCFQGSSDAPTTHKALLKYGTRIIRELLKIAPEVQEAFKS
jgi:hypothetical protein